MEGLRLGGEFLGGGRELLGRGRSALGHFVDDADLLRDFLHGSHGLGHGLRAFVGAAFGMRETRLRAESREPPERPERMRLRSAPGRRDAQVLGGYR